MNPDDYGGYTRAEIAELLEWDWAYTGTVDGGRLHHVETIQGPAYGGSVGVQGVTSCGRHSGTWVVPGLMSRMGMQRCKRCCDALGIARGIGSPKNDDDLREWVKSRLAYGGGVTTTVKVGQVWASCDPRDHHRRRLLVIAVEGEHAQIRHADNPDARKTWVAISRMRPNKRGYRLVEDVAALRAKGEFRTEAVVCHNYRVPKPDCEQLEAFS